MKAPVDFIIIKVTRTSKNIPNFFFFFFGHLLHVLAFYIYNVLWTIYAECACMTDEVCV